MLLVVLILLPFIFTNPVFPTLPREIPCVFPVKVTYKKSTKKNAKTYTKNLTSKITVKTPSIKTQTNDSVIAIGSTTAVKATVKPSTAKVTYITSDEKIATVDATSGIVTGVATGDVTITATTKVGKKTYTSEQKITVKKAILKSVAQTEYNKIEAVIIGDTKDVKASDFKITNEANKTSAVVKSFKAKKNAADTYVLETYTGMTDAKEYDVLFDGVTAKFTATDGTVAYVGLNKTEIAAATDTPIQMTTLDKNNVILSYTDLDKGEISKGKTSADVKLTKGYQNGTNLYLPAVGDTAEIKVTYHTGTFGTDGKEAGNIEQTFTVKAIDPALINLNYAVTVANNTATPAWKAESFKANTNVKLGDTRYASFYIVDEDGHEISDYTDYTVEAADKTKLLVDAAGTLTNASVGSNAVPVKGVSEGETYIIIKKADKVVASLKVNVVAKPVATSLDMNKTSVTVAEGANVTEAVKLALKDQYSDDMNIDEIKVTLLGKPSKTTAFVGKKAGDDVTSSFTTSTTSKTVSFDGTVFGAAVNNDDLGTYTFKISAKNTASNKTLDRALTVNLVKTATVQAYALKFNQTEIDTTIGTGSVNATDSDIVVNVAEMANGAAMDLYSATAVEYTVKNAKGDVIAKVKNGASAADIKTGAAVSANITSNTLTIKPVTTTNGAIAGNTYIEKNLDQGNYTVTAKFTLGTGKDVTCVGSFEVKDTQDKKVSYEIPNYDFGSNSVAAAFDYTTTDANGNNYVKVFYDGLLQTQLRASDIIEVKGTALANGGAYVKTVKLYVNVSGSDNMVPVTVTVNHVIDNCAVTGITE